MNKYTFGDYTIQRLDKNIYSLHSFEKALNKYFYLFDCFISKSELELKPIKRDGSDDDKYYVGEKIHKNSINRFSYNDVEKQLLKKLFSLYEKW